MAERGNLEFHKNAGGAAKHIELMRHSVFNKLTFSLNQVIKLISKAVDRRSGRGMVVVQESGIHRRSIFLITTPAENLTALAAVKQTAPSTPSQW